MPDKIPGFGGGRLKGFFCVCAWLGQEIFESLTQVSKFVLRECGASAQTFRCNKCGFTLPSFFGRA